MNYLRIFLVAIFVIVSSFSSYGQYIKNDPKLDTIALWEFSSKAKIKVNEWFYYGINNTVWYNLPYRLPMGYGIEFHIHGDTMKMDKFDGAFQYKPAPNKTWTEIEMFLVYPDGSMERARTDQYVNYSLPTPYVKTGANSDEVVSIEKLIQLSIVKIYFKSVGFYKPIVVDSFELELIFKKKRITLKSDNNQITEEMINHFEKLKSSDIVIFKNIKAHFEKTGDNVETKPHIVFIE